MLDAKSSRNLVAYVSIANEIKEISVQFLLIDIPTHLQSILSHATDWATGAVLKNQTRNYAAAVNDCFNIIDTSDVMPVHFELV